jgi:heme exporter protein A
MQLIAENVSIGRGERRLLGPVSFRVDNGRALLLTGPNGAGKTTLLRTVAGFLAPLGGGIRIEGGDPERTIGEQCHYVGHRDAVRASLTVGENAEFWGYFLGGVGDRARTALERFGLAAIRDVPASYLSAGQRRRLGLARLLLADRPLWLLDEPTAALDAAGAELLNGIMTTHLDAGGAIVAATHASLGLGEVADELRLGIDAAAA